MDDEILYLKDWNFTKELPGYALYLCPPWFLEDWLNQYEVCVCVCACVCVCVFVCVCVCVC